MSTLQERITQILAEQKINQTALADVAKVTKGRVSQWKNGPADSMEFKPARNIARAYGYAVEWLISGKGDKFEPKGGDLKASQPMAAYGVEPESADVKRLIMAFGWLTDDQQAKLLTEIEASAETNKAISRQLGHRWEYKPDTEVARHIKPAASPRSGGGARQDLLRTMRTFPLRPARRCLNAGRAHLQVVMPHHRDHHTERPQRRAQGHTCQQLAMPVQNRRAHNHADQPQHQHAASPLAIAPNRFSTADIRLNLVGLTSSV